MQPNSSPVVFDQRIRIRAFWLVSPFFVALVLLTHPVWVAGGFLDVAIRMTGLAAILACIFGRAWCALHVGGRKNRQLVTDGPYAYTRNPLYLFSAIGAGGVGLCFGSLVLGAVLFAAVAVAFHFVIAREEPTLRRLFGDAFEAYRNRVPRFWLKLRVPSRSERDAVITTSANALRRTVRDASWLLAAVPIAAAVHWAHAIGGNVPTLPLP